ncbi:MAG: L-threonylcarbamoyladenylate synthase [Anaerolineaceae bacterium]
MQKKQTLLMPVCDSSAIGTACEYLQDGKLIVFPTDTLYGVACDPWNPSALREIYKAKGRSTLKAIPVLVGAPTQLDAVIEIVPPAARALMEHFWPGALTLVLPKKAELPEVLTPYPGLAVRMPAHPFALSLLQEFGPLAVTSANLSGQDNPKTAAEVIEQLSGRVDLVLDGGPLSGGQASTIIDGSAEKPVLLREGPIAFADVLRVWERP